MRVKIGTVTIPNAEVERFIDLESGLPLSLIRVSYPDLGIEHGELVDAFHKKIALPFESEILKTFVGVHHLSYDTRTKTREFVFQERAAGFFPRYKKRDWRQPTKDKTMIFILPENVKDSISPEEIGRLPYIRLILRKHIPDDWFELGKRVFM